MKAGVVGVGRVGGAIAFALAGEGDWDELVLVDAAKALAGAKAEILRTGLRLSTHPVTRAGSLDDRSESEVVVLWGGQGRKPGMPRLDLLHANAGLVAELSREIAHAASNASLVVLTNPMDVMTTIAWRSTGWPRTRVLGSGTLLDSLRLRMILADRLKVPAVRVSATAIGEHGQRIVPVFSRARVEGRRLTLSPEAKEGITQRLREVSGRIVELKCGTAFGPARTTADLIAALVGPRPRAVPRARVLQGED